MNFVPVGLLNWNDPWLRRKLWCGFVFIKETLTVSPWICYTLFFKEVVYKKVLLDWQKPKKKRKF